MTDDDRSLAPPASVAPEPLASVAAIERWREGGPERSDFVGLDRNERVAPLPEWFLDELRSRVTSSLAMTYPAPHLLHEELAASLEVPHERLLVTSGNDAALRAVHLAFVRPRDRVVRLDPTYAMVSVYGRIFETTDVRIGYDERLELDVEALLDATVPGVRLVVIANPNQPTGTSVPREVLDAVRERCERAGALLVLDEAYQAFAGETAIDLAVESDNVLVLRTFSKAAGLAGLRVGFAAAAPAVLRALYNVRSAGETNAVAIEAARIAVARPELADEHVAAVAAGRAVVAKTAQALGLDPLPGYANFVLLRLPDGLDPDALVAGLRDRGYLVRGAYPYPGLDRCIRVTLGSPDVMRPFCEALAGVVRGIAA